VQQDPQTSTTIVFALYPGLTQLDFTGPHQVLSRVPGARMIVASAEGGEIVSDDGLRFGVARLKDIDGCAVLCIPGGVTCTNAMVDEAYMHEVRRLASGARYVTSVCTGSLILGAAGLLAGKRAACHWAWREHLAAFGATVSDERVCRDGNVITGGGVTAGIDFGLILAVELAGETVAQAIQLALQYAPAPPFDCGRPEHVPAAVFALAAARMQAGRANREEAIARAAEALQRRAAA
jgi:transcriptional regulator GlxA family with amidase domain